MSDDKKNPDDFSEEFGAEDDDDFSLPSFDEEDSSELSTSDSSEDSFSSSDSSSSSDEFVGSIFSTESTDDTGLSNSSQEDDSYNEGTDEYKYEDEDEEEEKKPSSKGFIIVIVIICIVLLGGGFAYLYLHQQKDNPLESILQEETLVADSTQIESDSLGGVASDPSIDVESEESTEDLTADAETKEEVQQPSETPSTPQYPSSSQASNLLNNPDGRFYIIIASFSFKKSAEDKVQDISRQGYTPKIIMPFQNSPYYRVAIEGFHSHAEAHRHIAKYRGTFGRSAWVLDYSR